MSGEKVVKDGSWFWPEMKCECGAIGCYDLTTDIGCRVCLTARGTIRIVALQSQGKIVTLQNSAPIK